MDDLYSEIEKIRGKFVAGFPNYVQVEQGWHRLVVDCDAELTALDPGYRIEQIKEKFGGLRYYFRPSDKCDKLTFLRMKETIYKYEGIARQTCEITGKPGILMKSIGGWYKTLNPDYAAERLHYARYSPQSEAPVAQPDRATDF